MQTQHDWMEAYKAALEMTSDGQLARHWGMLSCEISSLHKNIRKLSTPQKIMIANALNIDPIQIFISCDWDKIKEHEKEFAKSEYFKSVMKTYRPEVPRGFYKRRRF